MNNKNSMKDIFFRSRLIKNKIISNDIKLNFAVGQENYLSPLTKKIYESISPNSREPFLLAVEKNNHILNKIENNYYSNDPEYIEKMENNGLGFYMEDFVIANGYCPICGKKSLAKYSKPNIPVVDIVCTNMSYHLLYNKCFLFQLKISVNTNYFSLNRKLITVGSKKYGEIIMDIDDGSDIADKLMIPSYICIKLNRLPDQNFKIDTKNSFVIIPNYRSINNERYYKYTDQKINYYNSNTITWNDKNINTVGISSVLDSTIVTYQIFKQKYITNPYIYLDAETESDDDQL